MTLGLPIVKFLKYLFTIGLVAAIYFVFGLLGLLFKVPPSNAGALWPPAGIALAAILLLGKQVWPGVFLGNLCISIYAFGFDAQIAPVYFATGCGAAASAMFGNYLIKRFIGFPTPLITDRSILQFMFFGGPLSSLIAPTVGIISMRLVGIITDAEIPINWLSWWIGDTIGVLVFTPLVLTFFAQPQHIWQQRRTSVALPLLFTFVLVVGLFLYVRQIEQQQHHQQIKIQSITLSQAIKNRIQNDLNAINTLRLFFIGSSYVTNAEFDLFTEQSFSIFPEILSIRYASLDSIRQAKIDFSVQLNGVNSVSNDNALFIKLNALLTADVFEVNKDYISFENGVAELLTAIYVENELQGIIFTKISIANLVAHALENLNSNGCLLTISTDNSNDLTHKVIFSNVDNPQLEAYQYYSLKVANHQWLLSFYHDPVSENSQMHWTVWWVLVSCLFFTSLLGVGLLILTGRYFRTESIVDERTSALMNAKLIAESANKEKSQFLAKISHELRTPLNGILGFTHLLQKRSSISLEDRKKINIIKRCSDDLLVLINDLLDISAIESNQIRINISNFNFDNLLLNIIDVFQLQIDQKQLTLLVRNRPVSHDLQGDEKRIRQIIVNLINNAVKYTAKGVITICSEYRDSQLLVSIEDTGCGIAKENLEQIFSPFVQLSGISFSRDGVGLGLAITKELVNLMKGTLSVTSQIGKGSVFSVTLPLPAYEKIHYAVSLPDYQEIKAANSISILIVDDNEINLLLLTNMLELQGYRVDAATNGQEALELIAKNYYSVALVDLNMPIMSGMELVKAIREQEQHMALKIVAISAYADTHKKIEALVAGFDFYLPKPIDEDQLLSLIQAIHIKTG